MPINKNELKKRKWPLPLFPIGQEVIGRGKEGSGIVYYDDNGTQVRAKEEMNYASIPSPNNYLKSCYVREGKVLAIPLPILPGESRITSLVKDEEGKLFGVACGKKCHLFAYNSNNREVKDLGTIGGKCGKSLIVADSNSHLFIGTKPLLGEGYIYSFNPKSNSPKIKKLCCPVKGEGISALVVDNNLSRIYGLSSRTGTFFILEIGKCSVELRGRVDKDGLFSETLVVTSNGDVFGGCRWTQFFKYDLKKDSIIPLKIKAPVICGREMYNRIESLIWDEKTQSIYGGTSADGILFRFYPNESKIISLGKPLNQPRIRCLTIGKDNSIYGIAGRLCCHLFRYHPQEGDLRDMGILRISSPRYWHGYEFDSAVTGKGGEIYLGESDRISHLWMYKPKKQKGSLPIIHRKSNREEVN